MNKKVMALAVASALAAPAALAQTSNVQLYGRAVLGIDNYSAEGARDQVVTTPSSFTVNTLGAVVTTPASTSSVSGGSIDYKSRMRIFDNSSRVGLRGTEDLGNGLKAIFQIETGVNIDSGSQAGQAATANVSSGFWASRDSFVGLDSNFGRLTFGRQSIYWANGVNAQFAANYINTEIPWTNGTGLGRMGVTTARTSNTVAYTSPTFVGINGTLSYSPGAGCDTGTLGGNVFCQEAVQHNNSLDTDGNVWGLTLRGEWGPFYVQGDYARGRGNDSLTGASKVELDAYKLGASWGYMPGARIGIIWVRNEDNAARGLNGAGRVAGSNQATQDGWTLNWEHTFGNFQLMAQYGFTNDMKDCGNAGGLGGAAGSVGCSDSSSDGYMIAGRYFLSKRTWLFASYNKVSNDSNQFADYTGGNQTSVGAFTVFPYGADPEIWALGIFHQF
jgi:predicted porin